MKQLLEEAKLKNFILLSIAGFINAFGITVFLAPVKLYDSGISGTSMLLSQITPEYLSLSLFLLILNIPLLLRKMRKRRLLSLEWFSIIRSSSNHSRP